MENQKPRRTRAAAHQMDARRIRILAWVQAGLSFEEIGRLEHLSRERVRQIVRESFTIREEDRQLDQRRLNEVRLEPAMRLAAKAIIECKLEGVDRLLKVIAAMEKYGHPKGNRVYDENARAKLLAKLNMNAERLFPNSVKTLENDSAAPANL